MAYQQIVNQSPQIQISFVAQFNDYEFIDYIIITSCQQFSDKMVYQYLALFGDILEFSVHMDKIIVKFMDIRTIKEIEKIKSIMERDVNSFLFLHRTHFDAINEMFATELLKHIYIFNRDNTTDIMMKHTKIKPKLISQPTYSSKSNENSQKNAAQQRLPNLLQRNPLQELNFINLDNIAQSRSPHPLSIEHIQSQLSKEFST